MPGGAPTGNNNAGKGKPWREAIDKALKQYKTDEIKAKTVLHKIATKVVEDALAGNKDAWQEIGNRLDGRPAQSMTVSGDVENPLYLLPLEGVESKHDETE